MPVTRLTDAAVRALKSPSTQLDYWSKDVPGFGVRVSPAGRKTFFQRYRLNGRQRRLSLGIYPATSLASAQRKARKTLGLVADDIDPAQTKRDQRLGDTFADLSEIYLEKHAIKKRSFAEDRRIVNNELLPHWRTIKAKDLRRADVRVLLERIAERPAPIMANRVLAVIRKMYNFGISRDLVENNPCAQLERPGKERHRDRVLTDGEIRQFWSGLDNEPPAVAAFFRLRLVTAQRGGEIANMRWRDVELDNTMWTIPADHAKNGLPHRVPLSPPALSMIDALPHEGEYILAEARSKHVQGQAAARLGLTDFRGHDLRRTAASRMASSATPRLVIGKLLNHVESGVTAVYDRHSYDNEKRTALDGWARTLTGILKGKKASNVVSFTR